MTTAATPSVTTRTATPADGSAISALSRVVFGPGRFVRTAYRVREGTPPTSPFCRLAHAGERVVAALRMTEVTVGGTPAALLLGPLAVDPDFANLGYGRRLIAESLDLATSAGRRIVVLVGDMPYYGRLGFVPVPVGQIELPGPVDPLRILARELAPGALAAYRGLVAAAPEHADTPRP